VEAPPPTGAPVWVVGVPLSADLAFSLSQGILSGTPSVNGRPFLQTDASVSPGNSGGPLVSAQGGRLGTVSWKLVGAGAEGLGFAIPAASAERELGITWASASGPLPPTEPPVEATPVVERVPLPEPGDEDVESKAEAADQARRVLQFAGAGVMVAGGAVLVAELAGSPCSSDAGCSSGVEALHTVTLFAGGAAMGLGALLLIGPIAVEPTPTGLLVTGTF
jgi:S1-C subfamily serine protease